MAPSVKESVEAGTQAAKTINKYPWPSVIVIVVLVGLGIWWVVDKVYEGSVARAEKGETEARNSERLANRAKDSVSAAYNSYLRDYIIAVNGEKDKAVKNKEELESLQRQIEQLKKIISDQNIIVSEYNRTAKKIKP